MGVVHKLKSEVKDFIIKQKSNNPSLSCRKLSTLVTNNFKIELSKSSINAIIKEAGLSAPVGRTPKNKRRHITMPNLPILLSDTPGKEIQVQLPVSSLEADRKIEEERLLKEAQAKEQEKIRKAQEEAQLAREAEEAKRRAEEEAAKKAEEEARIKLEEESRLREVAEKEALRKQEEARLTKEAEEAKRRAEEENRLKTEADKKAQEEAEQERLLKEARAALEEKARRALEEERAAREAEEAKRRAEEEAAKKAEEEKWRKLAEEEAAGKAREETKAAPEAIPAQNLIVSRLSQIDNTGIILLKSVDYILGIGKRIKETIRIKLGIDEQRIDDLVDNIIYLPLLKDKIEKPVLDNCLNFLNELDNVKVLNLDIAHIIKLGLQEVRCSKVFLSDGTSLYLDGQMYSVWSSQHVPYDFVLPIHKFKDNINRYFVENSPLIIFNAPGYDMPSLEFFNFAYAMEAKNLRITNLTLQGSSFETIETLPISHAGKHYFVFGVWPWQFVEYRKVINLGEFKPLRLELQGKDIYVAGLEMALIHPGLNKQVVFNGCAVKTSLNEKTRLVILSNFTKDEKSPEEIAAIYLNHWPNLEEAFNDYSRKIELFTYTAGSQRFFNAESMNLDLDSPSNIKDLFNKYLIVLDAYVRWHLLPCGYEDKGFLVAKEQFYDLELRSEVGEKRIAGSFIIPEGYSFAKDLAYLTRRVNEKEVIFSGGVKLYLK